MNTFIIGTGRCGSTMLARMLNSHSEICVPFELQILFEYDNNGSRLYETFKEKINESFDANDFVRLIETRCPKNLHEYFDYRHFFEEQQYPIHNLQKLVNNFYNEIVKSKNKKIFVDQTPWQGQRIDILNELFPDAKYIHMIRDGRDVAISYTRTPWWHDDIGHNLQRWHTEICQIIDSSNKILKPNQILQVRYEDFIEEPESSIRHICNFLNVNFEDTMLDPTTFIDYGLYRKSDMSHITSAAMNEWSKNKTTSVFKGSLYAWKNYPDFDFSCIPEHVSQALQTMGYEKATT